MDATNAAQRLRHARDHRFRRWPGGQFGQPPEVLCDRGPRELELRAARSAQPQAAKAQDAFQVRELHFDLLPVAAGLLVELGGRDGAGHVTGGLVYRARDLAGRPFWTAPSLEHAGAAVIHGREIANHLVTADLMIVRNGFFQIKRVETAAPGLD